MGEHPNRRRRVNFSPLEGVGVGGVDFWSGRVRSLFDNREVVW